MGSAAETPGGRRRLNYRRYWSALYHRDVAGAQAILHDALRRWSPQRIYLQVFEPALNLSGTLFARGAINYHDEHFVTYHTLRFMRQVRRRFVPPRTTGPLALATGVEQESHRIGLRMVCDFLQADNWRIHWLASNDRGVVRQSIERFNPSMVMLSMGLDSSVTPSGRLIANLRHQDFRGLIAIGGRAVNCNPSLVEQLGADLTAPNGLRLVRVLRHRFATIHRDPA